MAGEQYVDIQAGLRLLGGDKEFYMELLDVFREKYTEYASDIRSSILGGDIGLAVKHAHTVKGAAANLGLAALSGSALKIEAALAGADIDAAQANLALYDGIYLKTVAEIDRLLDGGLDHMKSGTD